ncbi:hypothetical protein [uncultured Gammaproteobacteria bacterium]|nr:hypothetical protein [uncultured Gammaproteobacteria bacterium]
MQTLIFLLARLISEVFASPLNNQTAPNPLKITMQCMRRACICNFFREGAVRLFKALAKLQNKTTPSL